MAKMPTKPREKKYDTEDKRPSKGASMVYWIMLALMVFGLGGYGVVNFGGGVTTVGSVGSVDIGTKDYSRALQQEIQAFSAQTGQNVTMPQARALGLDRQVLQRLVTTAALDNEDLKLGISVGDTRLRSEITGMKAFQGPDGKFSRDAYAFVLKQNGMTEHEFEGKVRNDLARGLLQDAVISGFATPVTYADTLMAYVGQRRGFDILKLTASDLPAPVAAPTEDQLKAWYKDHAKAYTSPEAKRITYVSLLPDMLMDKIKIDDKTLRDLYQKKIDEYQKPERRLVERLVYPTEAAAKAAKAKLDAGQATFEALVKARGLALTDVDMGDVTKDELGKAGAAVFAAAEKSVVGPLQTDLGPALFRINGVLAAESTSFDEARPALLDELRQSRARDVISGQIEHLNDLLAGGATIEDLAKETDMQIGHIDVSAKTDEGIAAYEGFRKAVEKVTTDDYPSIVQLDDGGIVALRLDKVIPPAPIAFDKVREEVITDWTKDATDKALMARADKILKAVAGGAELGSFGTLDVQEPIERSGYVSEAPAGLLTGVFKMKNGATEAFQGDETVWLAHLTAVLPPAKDNADVKKMQAQITAQGTQGIANDAFGLFATALEGETGITLNQAAVNAVNAQFH